jgi:uncharacterized protein with PQ loop repeat
VECSCTLLLKCFQGSLNLHSKVALSCFGFSFIPSKLLVHCILINVCSINNAVSNGFSSIYSRLDSVLHWFKTSLNINHTSHPLKTNNMICFGQNYILLLLFINYFKIEAKLLALNGKQARKKGWLRHTHLYRNRMMLRRRLHW